MIKKAKVSPTKMTQDISPNKYPQDHYFEAYGMRIVTDDSQSGFAFTNEKGNTFKKRLPKIINVQGASGGNFEVKDFNTGTTLETVIYTNPNKNNVPDLNNLRFNYAVNIREEIVIFTSDLINVGYGAIFLYNPINNNLSLKYVDDLGYSINTPIRKALGRYENSLIKKIYFTDNTTLFKFANVADENLINIDIDELETSPNMFYSKPKLINIKEGGNFTAGVIQYAYNTYNKNGAETKISPFSDLITVNEGKGLPEGEIIRKSYEIELSNIPEDMTYLKVYRLFWSNINNVPEVKIIIEEEISTNTYTFLDDGNLDVGAITLEEILFLGNDPMIIKDLETKDNILFPVNIKYQKYDIDFDARAFRFDSNGDTLLRDNTRGDLTFNISNLNSQTIDETWDCINPSNKAEQSLTYLNVGETQDPNFNKYIYQGDGTTLGAQGKNVKIQIKRKLFKPEDTYTKANITLNKDNSYIDPRTPKSLKRDEVYRFYLRTTNIKGQHSFVKWICDLRMPNQDEFPITVQKNLDVFFSALYVEVTVNNLPSDVVSYEILRSERTDSDKTIVSQGIINPMVASPNENAAGSPEYAEKLQPSYLFRTWHSKTPSLTVNHPIEDEVDLNLEVFSENGSHYKMNSHIVQLFSPEIIFNEYSASSTDYMILVGGVANTWNKTWRYRNNFDDVVGPKYNGVSRSYAESTIFDPSLGLWVREGDGKNFGGYNVGSIILSDNSGDEKNYRSIIRKATVMTSNGSALLKNNGHLLVDNSDDTLQSYTDIIGQNVEFMDSIYVQRNQGNNRHKLRSYNSKNLTMQIGFYQKGLGTVLTQSNVIPKTPIEVFPLVDHKRIVQNQYGGDTYEAISRGNPVVVSDHVPKSQNTVEVFNGDTYVSYFNLARTTAYSPESFIFNTSWRESIIFPVETSINLDLRTDRNNSNDYPLSRVGYTFDDFYEYNNVYSLQKKYDQGTPKPFNFTEISEFDTRVIISDTKINGELVDNWLRFGTNNYKDLNAKYGAITGVYEFADELYTLQSEAVARLIINPRVYQQSSDGVSVLIGSGETLQDYKYLSTSSGSINQFGVIKSPYGLYYIDLNNKKLMLVNNNVKPVSDIEGMHSFFRKRLNYDILKSDNPLIKKGITGYFDNELQEVYITILQAELETSDNYTITFNNLTNGFHNFHPIKSSLNFINGKNSFSVNDSLTSLYLNKTNNYGIYFDQAPIKSYVTFILNPDVDVTKVFNNLLYNSKVIRNETDIPLETITSLKAYNDYQNADIELTVGENVIRKFREWRINLPRQNNTRNRLRSQYLYLTLEFQNDGVSKLELQDIIISYNVLPASFI
jgi:hypothetical protein